MSLVYKKAYKYKLHQNKTIYVGISINPKGRAYLKYLSHLLLPDNLDQSLLFKLFSIEQILQMVIHMMMSKILK